MRPYLFTGLIVLNIFLSVTTLIINNQVTNLQLKIEKALDVEYVKGFEAALDCRGLMSAPLCEELLKKGAQ